MSAMHCYTRRRHRASRGGRARCGRSRWRGSREAPSPGARRSSSRSLMPAVHALWKDGWDLKLAVRKVGRRRARRRRRIINGAPFGKKTETGRWPSSKDANGRRARELILSPDATLEASPMLSARDRGVDEAGLDTHPPPRPPKGQRDRRARSEARRGERHSEHSASFAPCSNQTSARSASTPTRSAGVEASKPRTSGSERSRKDLAQVVLAERGGRRSRRRRGRGTPRKRAALKKQFEEVDLPRVNSAEEVECGSSSITVWPMRRDTEAERGDVAARRLVAARDWRLRNAPNEAAATAAAREAGSCSSRGDPHGTAPRASTVTKTIKSHTTDRSSRRGFRGRR